jgi:hypothetical protein
MISRRTAEGLIRAAYEYEELASRLRREGYESHAYAVQAISSSLGNVGRSLLDKIEEERQ